MSAAPSPSPRTLTRPLPRFPDPVETARPVERLIAVAFPAQPARARLLGQRLRERSLLDLRTAHLFGIEEMVAVVRRADGSLDVDPRVDVPNAGADPGALLDLLSTPPEDIGRRSAFEALMRSLADAVVDDHFVERIALGLAPSSSALFALTHEAQPDRLLDALGGAGGWVMISRLARPRGRTSPPRGAAWPLGARP
jgi:uncharacterized membrane protein